MTEAACETCEDLFEVDSEDGGMEPCPDCGPHFPTTEVGLEAEITELRAANRALRTIAAQLAEALDEMAKWDGDRPQSAWRKRHAALAAWKEWNRES